MCRYLEAERFDCKGNDGRLPIVSLEAVQSEFISSPGFPAGGNAAFV